MRQQCYLFYIHHPAKCSIIASNIAVVYSILCPKCIIMDGVFLEHQSLGQPQIAKFTTRNLKTLVRRRVTGHITEVYTAQHTV